MTPQELNIRLPHLTLAAQAWGPADGLPVLGFHGWLDNAATFARLLPVLLQRPEVPPLHVVALDLPGHGLSEHRPPGMAYHFVDMVPEVLQAADSLGWDRFLLLGHSMGAALATLVAAVAPERISHLMLIDGLGPISAQQEDACTTLKTSLRQEQALAEKRKPIYASPEEAVRARHAVGGISEVAVQTLVKRGLEPCEGGFTWRTDPSLRVKSRHYFTEDQVRSFVKALECPVLAIEAAQTTLEYWRDLIRERSKLVPQVTHTVVPGQHHLHLDDPEPTAAVIAEFLQAHLSTRS